jgi:hypothetical protein
LIRCNRCLNSVFVDVIHNPLASSESAEVDDGRPAIIEQLEHLGWAVSESEDGPVPECPYHEISLGPGEVIAAEFDIRSFDVIENTFELRCAACAASFSVTVRQRPDELSAAAGEHFVRCQGIALAWTDWRANLPARREGALSSFELIGRLV